MPGSEGSFRWAGHQDSSTKGHGRDPLSGAGIAGLSKKDQGKIHDTRSESCIGKTSQGSLFQS